MHIAAMLTSLPLPFAEALIQVRDLGFTHVDIVALEHRPPEHLDALAESGLHVSCAAIGRALAADCALDHTDFAARKQAVEAMYNHIIDAARLGATHCYVVPTTNGDDKALMRFADSCAALADFAANRMVQLCVEHFPGRALPTAGMTLDWLERSQLDQVQLLVDIGHCLISEEDPAGVITRAGDRLGYVHFDDNDSAADLHWPLLTGRLTEDMVDAIMRVLHPSDYSSGIALELNPTNDDPVRALADGRALLSKYLYMD